MVEPVDEAGQVADPVAVAVGERARVDLVDHGGAPPVVGPGGCGGVGHDGETSEVAPARRPPVPPPVVRRAPVLRDRDQGPDMTAVGAVA